jgi:hypothetical protein
MTSFKTSNPVLENKQIMLNAKIARLLLKNNRVKNQKPFLINAIVTKLYSQEGIKPSPHIFTELQMTSEVQQ